MAKRIVPSDRAKMRAKQSVPVDTTGMDPEMVQTINPERERRGLLDMILSPWGGGSTTKIAALKKKIKERKAQVAAIQARKKGKK